MSEHDPSNDRIFSSERLQPSDSIDRSSPESEPTSDDAENLICHSNEAFLPPSDFDQSTGFKDTSDSAPPKALDQQHEKIQSVAARQNHSAASLDRSDLIDCRQPPNVDEKKTIIGSLTSKRNLGSNSKPADSEIVEINSGTQTVTAGDLWRSLLWLVTLVLMFLSVISFGPLLVEKYQYAAAKGRMQAQYESANDILSNVSFKDSTVASELVVHKIRPSVVSVRATSHSNIAKFRVQGTGQGSGVILSQDGFIVTNNHVVEGADQIEVTLADRREYIGKVVGRDRETDLAVIRVDANDLIAAEWGDSNQLELGSAVWAMGSPFGLDQTVTRGIISGKHRRTADTLGNPNPHQDLLQTDAAINPGNSGGPLVNSRGEVIGINTSIYGESFQGISFAVPSTLAKEIVNRLIEKGKIQRGYLGVEPADVTHSDALRLQLPKIAGALLVAVEPNTPAANAGLRPNDVITELNGNPIENQVLLFRHIGMIEPGSNVEVKFVRQGTVQSVNANIGLKKPAFQF